MKVGVVGSGLVGATSAYALVMAGVASEIVLVDKNKSRAEAEANDIFHAVPFAHRTRVSAGEYQNLQGSRVVIVAAGINQKPGETRLELLQRNAAVFREVIPSILDQAPDTLLLIVTNPVDVMTHLAADNAKKYGVPASRVIGSGATLDTARFRALLGRFFGIDPHHVHGYVVGEHGDSEVLTWSVVSIGGSSLDEFCRFQKAQLNDDARREIDDKVRNAAYQIIAGKGATYYGVAGAVAHIVDVILDDHRAILTVTARIDDVEGVRDVTVSLPRLVGGEGVLATFPLPLNAEESKALQHSAEDVRRAIDDLESSCNH